MAPQRDAKAEARGMLRWHAVAFAFYSTVSCLLLAHPGGLIFGRGQDPIAFIWFLSWYPYTLLHHLNPLLTHMVWQPVGLQLLWVTSVPLLAFACLPLTTTVGPVATYDALVLLAPVLTAWCMYRLCLSLTSSMPGSMIGGLLVGFSTYQMAQSGTLNLATTFLVPCLGWLAVARLQGRISRTRAVLLLIAMLVAEFFISMEIFATTGLFAVLAWGLAWMVFRDRRPALRMIGLDGVIAAAAALVVLAPLLGTLFSNVQYTHRPARWPDLFAAGVTSLIVPLPTTWLNPGPGHLMLNDYFGDVAEQDSYIGLPLLLIVYVYGRDEWRRAALARFLVIAFAGMFVFSLGPHLWVGKMYTGIPMPWDVFAHVPLLCGALTVRFALFTSLLAGLMAAFWISQGGAWRVAAGLSAFLVIWPAPHGGQPVPVSRFFAPGRVQAVLGPSPQLLVLPFGSRAPSLYWQVENRFGFSQAGTYLGFPPAAMQTYPAVLELFSGSADRLQLSDFVDYVTGTKTRYIVVGPGMPPALLAKIERLDWPERRVDDATIITVPSPAQKVGQVHG